MFNSISYDAVSDQYSNLTPSRLSIATDPIKFFHSGKLNIGSGVVLGYFASRFKLLDGFRLFP